MSPLHTLTGRAAVLFAAGVLSATCLAGPVQGQSASTSDLSRWSAQRVAATRGGPVPFGAIPPGSVRFDDDGTVYLLDIQAAQIYIFDAELDFQGALGRRGRGPGEFIQPTLLGVEAGMVAVFDPGTSRVTVFRDGIHSWDVSWQMASRGVPRRVEVIGGEVVIEVEPFPFPATGSSREAKQRRIVRLHRNGVPVTLMTFPGALSPDPQPPSTARRPVIFAPSLHWTAGPAMTLFTSVSDRYEIQLRDLAGGGARPFATRQDVSAAETSEAVRASVREQTLRRFAENRGQPALSGLNGEVVRQSVSEMEFAERLPLTGDLIHGFRDHLLVQRGIGLVDGDSAGGQPRSLVPDAWDVFRSDGRYAGRVAFPDGFVPIDGFGDLVVGVREGDLGEVVLELFRITES